MTDLYVIVHTDRDGSVWTLGGYIHPDLESAEHRVAERRRTAIAEGWTDQYRAYRLVPVGENPATA